jgi:hypothetical protein
MIYVTRGAFSNIIVNRFNAIYDDTTSELPACFVTDGKIDLPRSTELVVFSGKVHAFCHGHLKANTLSSAVANISLPLGIKIDYVHVGHWHSASKKEQYYTKVYTNGSAVGTDDYAEENGWHSKASQGLLIIDSHNDIDIDIILN